MNKKNKKYGILYGIRRFDKYAILRSAAASFLIAAVTAGVLLVSYAEREKNACRNVLYETSRQSADSIKNVLSLETAFLEELEKLSDVSYGMFSSVYTTTGDVGITDRERVLLSDEGKVEIRVKAQKENADYDYVCARVDTQKLSDFVDNGAYNSKLATILYQVNSGSIIINTAEKYGFMGRRIGFLLDHEFKDGYFATQMFSDIDDKKSGYTVIESQKEKYSVSYVPVGFDDLYLLSIVPKNVLYDVLSNGLVIRGTIVFLAFIGVLFVLLSLKGTMKRNIDEKKSGFKFDVMQMILEKLSEDDFVEIYIYKKDTDVLEIIKDSKGYRKAPQEVKGGFSYFIKKEGLDESNSRKLRNTINLTGPGKDMKITVFGKDANAEYPLELSFSCIKQSANEGAALVCIAKRPKVEFSKEKNPENVGKENYNTTCIELFLERNMWHFLWNNEPVFEKLGFGTGMQNNFDRQLKGDILPCIKPSERQRVLTLLDRLSLLEAFRNGTAGDSSKFHIADEKGEYRLIQLDVRIYRDNYNDEIKANFYFRRESFDET